ncbi:Uncharacterized protein Rs2_50589 [Raphanus sativus]|nr:Uncharacterized protein Rs2_50589 [Raphanus sativus]
MGKSKSFEARSSPHSVPGGTSGEDRDRVSSDDPPTNDVPPMFTQHQDPVDSGIPPPVETDVEETVRVHQDPVDAGPSATQTSGDPGGNNEEVHDSNIIPDVSGVVNQILSDAGVCEEAESPVVNPSKSSNSESHSDVTFQEKPDVRRVSGDGPSTNDPAEDVVRRQSKRRHTSPQRYSPSEPGLKKDAPKKPPKPVPSSGQPSKKTKKTGVEAPQPAPKMPALPLFIGGFNAFAPPSVANREIFLQRVNAPKLVGTGDSEFSVSSLNDLFHCTGVCSHEAMDRVILFIRNRRDRLPSARFDFLQPSFLVELMRNFAGFSAINEKHKFVFSLTLKSQFLYRPGWFTHVDFLYCPYLIKQRQWVGLIIDLTMAAIYAVDFNPASPSEFDVNSDLTPISIMLPHLMSRFCIVPNPGEYSYSPLPISRIEVPILLEHPGFSGVAALILLELNAIGEALNSISLTEADVRVAAENYAIAAMSMG